MQPNYKVGDIITWTSIDKTRTGRVIKVCSTYYEVQVGKYTYGARFEDVKTPITKLTA